MFVALDPLEYINTQHITTIEFSLYSDASPHMKLRLMNGNEKAIYDKTVIAAICDRLSIHIPYYLLTT